MARYISSLQSEADLYCNLGIGKVCNVALSIFPRLMREFDFDMIAFPPDTSYTRKDKLDTTLALTVNRNNLNAIINEYHQMAFQIRATESKKHSPDIATPLRTNNRGRVDTVNINTAKGIDWKTPNILTHVHKGLAWLVDFQMAQDRGVFFSQDDLHYYFTTTLHTVDMFGSNYVFELRIILFKNAFSIRPNS